MYEIQKTNNPAYTTKDVKQQFKLQHLEDFTVIPLIRTIARWFALDLKENCARYGISDFIIGKEDQSDRALDNSIAVVDGKIVTTKLQNVEVFIEGIQNMHLGTLIQEEWGVGGIEFNGAPAAANKLLDTLKQYAGRHSIDLLMKSTTPNMHQNAISFLGGEIEKFYAPHM